MKRIASARSSVETCNTIPTHEDGFVLTDETEGPVSTRVCKTNEGDRIMKQIMQLCLLLLRSALPGRAVRDVEFTGSIATGEATVIVSDSSIICSDLDMVVSVGFPHYVIMRAKCLLPKLAEQVNAYLSAKGLRTHVTFSLSAASGLRFLKARRIYSYEFASNISVIKRDPSKVEPATHLLPTKEDAIQLVFTTCADYAFLDSMLESSTEKVYCLAKRYLTLLYAVLISEGIPARSYERRLSLALESPAIAGLFSAKGVEFLVAFTQFKLMGDISQISKVIDATDQEHLVDRLKMLLNAQIKTILIYQLCENRKQRSPSQPVSTTESVSLEVNDVTLKALESYFCRYAKSMASSLMYSIRFVFLSLLSKRFRLMPLAVRLFCLRHSLRVTANYLVGLLFLFRTGLVESRSQLDSVLRELRLGIEDIQDVWQTANNVRYS